MIRRDPQRGFTLLELMISLAIMAMIALMIGSALSSGTRILARSSIFGIAVDQALARTELRRLIEATLPSQFPAQEQKPFAGTADSLRFLALVDDGTFWPGAPVSALLAKQEDGRIVLTLGGLSEIAQAALEVQIALTEPNGQMELSYYGQRSANEAPAWHPNWPAEQGLPMLVKLILSDNERSFPPLVVRPGKRDLQSEMSLSSLVPPATPSRP